MKIKIAIVIMILLAGYYPASFAQSTDKSFSLQSLYEMTPEQEQKTLKKLPPEIKQDLEVIKKYDKKKYFKLLRRSYYKTLSFLPKGVYSNVSVLTDKKGEKNKAYELEVKTEMLAEKYKHTKGAEQSDVKAELINKLGELFEFKEQERRKDVQELEQKLSELKKSLDVRQKNKEEIIRRRVEELLGTDKYLEWD